MMLVGLIPEFISATIRDSMYSAAFFIPASSSGPFGLRDLRSNQEGMVNPELRVTGILLALGQMSFRPGGLMEERVLAQPWPESPRPWRKMREAVCWEVGWTRTGSGQLVMVLDLLSVSRDNAGPIHAW